MLENVYQINSSKLAKKVLMLVFISSLLVVLTCNLNVFYKAIGIVYLIASMIPLYRQVVRESSLQLRPFSLREWELIRKDSEPITATLAPDTLVTPYLLVLRFHSHHKTHSYFVLRDSMQARSFKSLLLTLKVAAS